MEIRRANAADASRALDTLDAAMTDDPFVEWLVRPGRAHVRARRRYLEVMLTRIALVRGVVHVAEDAEGRMVGAALWAPPHTFALTVAETLRILPRMIDVVGFSRIGRVSRTLDAIEADRPPEPRWLLTLVGVLREARHQGVGTALLELGLAQCDEEGARVALETARESNLRFYERLGFEVTARRTLEDGGPTSWTLVREPR
jgi:ribosomal protein S18 acetylase RimI-like enzyme